jgi:hypothetical protein
LDLISMSVVINVYNVYKECNVGCVYRNSMKPAMECKRLRGPRPSLQGGAKRPVSKTE